jgi:holo-[acyl-carrier protein] synthase
MHGSAPIMGDEALGLIEVVADAWGRPRIRLHGEVAKPLEDVSIEISLSHDGDYATAYAVVSADSR